MIPLVIGPLTNLQVLVTRPALQAESLCNSIVKLGGEVIRFPVLDVKAREVKLASANYDLIIFVSSNAVTHGAKLLKQLHHTQRIAVIGNATAAALKALDVEAAIVAPPPFNSEALLQHAALQAPPKLILLVKGVGGRDLLYDTLLTRGAQVEVAEVYQRIPAKADETTRSTVQRGLYDGTIDVLTLTSTEIARAMSSMLDPLDFLRVKGCTVLAGSARIAEELPALGWRGPILISATPDDESMLNALTR